MKTLFILLLTFGYVDAQSFYANRHKNGRSTQLNGKTVMQRKQVSAYQQHSTLYKIRRDIAHSKKRKNFKKAKTR